MDGLRLDDLTRTLAASASRRAVLQRIVAGVGGGLLSLAGHGAASGQVCRDVGRRCAQHGNCCSGLCDPVSHVCACPSGTASCRGACVAIGGCCIDGETISAGTINPANQCQACLPATSATAWSNRPHGETCDDGSDCTQTDTCQDGAWIGGNPIPCRPPNECELSVSCTSEIEECSTNAR